MTKSLYLVILFVLLGYGCADIRGHRFERVSTWQTNEWAALQQLPEGVHPPIRPARLYRAVWADNPVLTVYLRCEDVESVGRMSWSVWAFDGRGRLVKQGGLVARPDFGPVQLLAVSPLRAGFGHRNHVQEIDESPQ